MYQRRFKLHQKGEREYWEGWKSNRDSETKAKEYWQYHIGILRSEANLKPGSKILDIGCGPYGLISYLDQGQRYALDPSMDFYVPNFDMPKEVNWIVGSGVGMPFRDDCLDVVVTTNTMDHTLNPKKFLSEINRVLNEDGFLFLTVNIYARRVKLVKRFLRSIGAEDIAHPCIFTSSKEVEQLIRKSGFKVFCTSPGIGDLGWAAAPAGRRTPLVLKAKEYFTRAVELRRKEGWVGLLRASMRFVFLIRARQPLGDFIFLAVK